MKQKIRNCVTVLVKENVKIHATTSLPDITTPHIMTKNYNQPQTGKTMGLEYANNRLTEQCSGKIAYTTTAQCKKNIPKPTYRFLHEELQLTCFSTFQKCT